MDNQRKNRTYLCIDLKSFYASVECMLDMSLKDKPIAVGGDVENRHGIILAKNYHAKKYGIQTGEALWQAKQKCKDLINEYNLDMQIIDASFTFDRSQLLFRFLSDNRVDFRQLAKDLDLPVANKKESTGICFIGERDFREFLMGEVRYASLAKSFPEAAEALFEKTKKDAIRLIMHLFSNLHKNYRTYNIDLSRSLSFNFFQPILTINQNFS